MSGENIEEYRSALQRLVDADTTITLNAVSIEAGRGEGAIKRSRPEFEVLIGEIAAAAKAQKARRREPLALLEVARKRILELEDMLNESAGREISQVKQILQLKEELVRYRGGTVVPILDPEASK